VSKVELCAYQTKTQRTLPLRGLRRGLRRRRK
jgi:ribosome modulation factor